MHCDVLIIGAGPAGATCANILARAGRSVILLDRLNHESACTERFSNESYKVGESLPASVNSLLKTLELPPLQSPPHKSIPGSDSLWAGERMQQDFMMQAQGTGWRLDRLRFEYELKEHALKNGAQFVEGHLTQAHHDGHAWQLKTDNGKHLHSYFLIDASGRRAVLSRMLNQPRKKGPPLVALWAVTKHRDTASEEKPCSQTLIESQAQGWWYAAYLPNGRAMAIFHTSANYATTLKKSPKLWQQQLEETKLIRKKISSEDFDMQNLKVNEARSAVLSIPYGKQWAACGDAALSFDPISSQGIFHSIASADMLCKALLKNSRDRAFPDYHKQLLKIFDIYRQRREVFYHRAHAFHGDTFWEEQLSFKKAAIEA